MLANDGAEEQENCHKSIRDAVVAFISDNFLLGSNFDLDDDASLLAAGILDSTGAIELVSFLEQTFSISIADTEITAENLDSVDRICLLIGRKEARSAA